MENTVHEFVKELVKELEKMLEKAENERDDLEKPSRGRYNLHYLDGYIAAVKRIKIFIKGSTCLHKWDVTSPIDSLEVCRKCGATRQLWDGHIDI